METYGNSALKASVAVSAFISRVYMWMTVGLAITGVTAWYIANTPTAINAITTNRWLLYGLLIAQVVTVIALSAAVEKMSSGMATLLFVVYSLLSGATFSVIFIVYPIGAIYNAFFTTAGMFLVMSVYGTVTKRDLTSWGNFLTMGLIGIIIAMLVNFFLKSTRLDFIISCIGVIVFTGLTAYDTQKLRRLGAQLDSGDESTFKKYVIIGALTLYLDFINLFLMLLRLFGRNK